jgi:hypothetical protein
MNEQMVNPRLILVAMAFVLSTNMIAQLVNCSELFISEFLEGDLLNKAVEIYNPKEESVNLTGYTLSVYANGSTEATFIHELSGSLPAYHTYVVCNAGSLQAVLDIANATSDVCSFNGNDALVLAYEGLPIDIIGVVGEDPQGPWAVGEGATENYTLVRKSSVQTPSLEWTESVNQWDVYAEDTISEIGEHNSVCDGTVSIAEMNSVSFVSIYPNPCANDCVIDMGGSPQEGAFYIRDLNSKLLLEGKILSKEGKLKVDLSGLDTGIYILEVHTNQGFQRMSLVVDRP